MMRIKGYSMTNNIFSLVQRKKNLAGMGLLVLLLGTTFFIQSLSQNLKKVSLLQSGIQTCFSRVAQTYTAKLLGDTGALYLDSGFMNATEECFGETMAQTEEHFSKTLKSSAKKLNTLASDVHWFQQRIGGDAEKDFTKTTAGVSISNLGSRFEKLEQNKDQIYEATEELKTDIISTLSSLKVSFYILAVLLPFILIWDFAERKSLKERNKKIENEALEEIEGLGVEDSSRVEDIIKMALEQNELVYCSKLFSNYHANTSFRDAADFKTPSNAKVEIVNASSKENYEEQIDRIWSESEVEDIQVLNEEEKAIVEKYDQTPEGMDAIKVDTVLGKVVNILSNKLLAEGIFIDMDIDESIDVFGKEESMEQVFYHVIQNAVKNSNSGIAPQRVKVGCQKLGGTVVISVADTGSGFSSEFLSSQSGLTQKDELPISLQICDEFMKEFSGEVSFANESNEDGEVTGSVVKLVFKRVIASQINDNIRIRDIQKGTKKEILARMKESTIA